MAGCRFNVNDECIAHGFADRCYTDALPDRYCFAACPHDDGVYPDTAITLRCLNCQVTLPLGPAAADTEQVKVEKRAAELASIWNCPTPSERLGWDEKETIDLTYVRGKIRRTDHDVPLNLDSPNWQSGYLARIIATHDEKEQT